MKPLALYEAMLEQGVGKVEPANRLCPGEKAVRRLHDPLHRSHFGAVETALRALGRRLTASMTDPRSFLASRVGESGHRPTTRGKVLEIA